MSIKKIMVFVASVVAAGIVLFLLVLFLTIKTKSMDIGNYEPFREWIGKTVRLNRQTVVFKEEQTLSSRYPYTLLDDMHPDWQHIKEREMLADPDIELIQVFPTGATLTFEKAVLYTNGISGFSTPVIFGILSDGKKTYRVGYQWGKESMGRRFDKINESWQFHQTPWQIRQDTVYYAL